jgi:hypothetical protein
MATSTAIVTPLLSSPKYAKGGIGCEPSLEEEAGETVACSEGDKDDQRHRDRDDPHHRGQ